MREGTWKLVSKHPGGWELCGREADRTEVDDLKEMDPGRAARVATPWQTWARRVGREPWPVR